MSLNRTAAAALLIAAALPLTGCPLPTPYPMPVPDVYVKRSVDERPANLAGPTLADAYHQATRWLQQNDGAGARLLAAEAQQVDRAGRTGRNGWVFTFAIGLDRPYPLPKPLPASSPRPKYVLSPGEPGAAPPPDRLMVSQETDVAEDTIGILPFPGPLPKPHPKPVPTPQPNWLPERVVTIGVDGTGRVLAPEAATTASRAAIDFSRTIALIRVLDQIPDLGAQIGPAGARVALAQQAGRTVFEIDPQVAYRAEPIPEPYYGPEPYDAPQPHGESAASGGPGHHAASAPASASAARRPATRPNPSGGYSVKCVAPPSPPYPYQTDEPGVLYRGTYVFDAYSGELVGRPQRL
ncbi:MAG: hypothetical protein FJZ01_02585 [Candidatus Sericytochromatia bacterium]|nr:hypothetical protein [Candidatus Tanganyikabacteria bacterium]